MRNRPIPAANSVRSKLVSTSTSPFENTGLENGKCYGYRVCRFRQRRQLHHIRAKHPVKVDTTGPTVSAITSKDPGGVTATGKIQNGATLIVTFNSPIDPTSIGAGCPSSCAITGAEETRTAKKGHVFLVIPGITASGGADTGSVNYLAGEEPATATFTATVSFSTENTVLTIAVSELGGAAIPTASEGELKFAPVNTITDLAGNGATGEKKVKLKLF